MATIRACLLNLLRGQYDAKTAGRLAYALRLNPPRGVGLTRGFTARRSWTGVVLAHTCQADSK